MLDPVPETTPGSERFAFRLGAALLGVAALALLLSGGVLDNFRTEAPVSISDDIPRPLLHSPAPEAILETPPLEFRWSPSGNEYDCAQFLLYRGNLERVWASGPLRDSSIVVPLSRYDGIPAGETCAWKVREVADGKPLVTSQLGLFEFDFDTRGDGRGEAREIFQMIDD